MQEIRFKGSYYEIGLNNGKRLVAEKVLGFIPKFSQENLEKSKPYEKAVNDYCPGLLDEFRGMAEGCGVDYQTLVAHELTPYRFKPKCLVLGITDQHTQSGKPLFVRNHEWIEEDGEHLRVLTVQPKGKLASYGFTFNGAGLASRYEGINKAGLIIASASATFMNSGPGVIFNTATRWILDNFKTTEEAVEFISSIPKVWGENYLIMDKHETLVRIESHRNKTLVTYPKNGFDLITLIYESEEMRAFTPNEVTECKDMFEARRKFLDAWFAENKGNITEELIIKILQKCENRLHYHKKNPDGTTDGTCWSWVASPKTNKVLISLGAPCKNEYKPYKIDYSFDSQ